MSRLVTYTLPMLALLGLCAWTPKPAHAGIKSIGIIVALGDTCMFEHVTDAPLQWIGPPQASFLEISDWGIDDEVTSLITTTLAPRYAVQPIAIEHQDFDTWTYDLLTRRVRELPVPEAPVDAYLLVLRDWDDDAVGGTDHTLGGLGLYRRDLAKGPARYAAFAAYRLVLMEPDRGGVIRSRAVLSPNGLLAWRRVSPSLWPRTQNDLTDAQRKTLRADFLTLIGESLPRALRQLGFATR